MKDFGARLQVVGILPTLLATFVVVFFVVSGAPVAPLDAIALKTGAEAIGLAGAVWITVGAVALAVTLQPLQFRLVQLLEGYWPGRIVAPVRALGIAWQRRKYLRAVARLAIVKGSKGKLRQLVAASLREAAAHQIRARFPDESRLLPTALGNTLRCTEDKVGRRYGIQVVTLWPRLHLVLPPALRDELDDEVNQLDVSCRLSVTWLLAAVICTSFLASNLSATILNWGWALIAASLWALSALAYRSAIEAAEAHGQDIEVTLDLHRHLLIEAMRLPATRTLSEDRRVFPLLSKLFTTYSSQHDLQLEYRESSKQFGTGR